jgi:uncharacterized membrane protein YeaQ/YmgE (transglycosylase-associated protein family)
LLGAIIFWIIVGLIAGVVAKLVVPGDDPGGYIITILLGVMGAIVAGFLASLIGFGGGGFIWTTIIATIGAIILLAIYRISLKGLSTSRGIGNEARGVPVSPRGQPRTGKTSAEYDVFISYRRDRGVEAARLIANALKEHRLRTFLDVDELGAGHFDEALLETITNTPSFVVLLTPQALDRAEDAEEQDWLRQEISQAIKVDRNVVPIMWPEFRFPEPQTLPEDIRAVRTYQGVSYSYEFFDAMINRLLRYLR